MIDDRKDYCTFVCDYCEFQHPQEADEFHDVLDEIKSAGWRVHKDEEGYWTHLCPDCEPDYV